MPDKLSTINRIPSLHPQQCQAKSSAGQRDWFTGQTQWSPREAQNKSMLEPKLNPETALHFDTPICFE